MSESRHSQCWLHSESKRKGKRVKAHTRNWYPHKNKQTERRRKRKGKRVKAHTRARYAHEGKMSDLAQAGYMLVQLRLAAYLYGINRHKACARDGQKPIQPMTAICWYNYRCRHIYAVKAQDG